MQQGSWDQNGMQPLAGSSNRNSNGNSGSSNQGGGLLASLSRKWVSGCNSVASQTSIRVVNRSPFPLLAQLSVLGVVYQETEVPACEDEDAQRGAAASLAVGELPCGHAWYAVTATAYSESELSEDKVLGPPHCKVGVYGGARVYVNGNDPRFLTLSTDPTLVSELMPAVNKAVENVATPLNDILDKFKKDWETRAGAAKAPPSPDAKSGSEPYSDRDLWADERDRVAQPFATHAGYTTLPSSPGADGLLD